MTGIFTKEVNFFIKSISNPNKLVKLTKWNLDTDDSIWKYDMDKSTNGPYLVEQKFQAGNKQGKFKVDQKPYGKHPVVMVFKTSNRSNAKTKIKVFNKNMWR